MCCYLGMTTLRNNYRMVLPNLTMRSIYILLLIVFGILVYDLPYDRAKEMILDYSRILNEKIQL